MNPRPPGQHRDALPREGDVIADKYRMDHVLGRGGMGLMVAAQHIALRQPVAVKFLLPESMELEGASERFLREARAAAAIQSEHVARVLDVGTLESGSPYMVMEYLTGVHLGQLLRSRGPLPATEAVDYVLQVCEAIAEAHALGIIHRDLKPANLFLTARADGSPLVKVLDFGLSKPIRPDAPNALDVSLTAANTVLGSPHYMSPEQIRCLKTIDGRTDIWSLGVILYQLLAGRRPFEANAMVVMFMIIGADPPVPLHALRPDLPAPLADVVMRCMEKDVSRRVQSVAELAQALAPFGSERAWVSVERICRVLANHPQPSCPPLPAFGAAASSVVSPAIEPDYGGAFDSTTAMASTLEDDTKRTLSPARSASSFSRGRSVALAVSTAVSVVLLGTIASLGIQSPLSMSQAAGALPAPTHGGALEIKASAPPHVAAAPPPAPISAATAAPIETAAPSVAPTVTPALSASGPVRAATSTTASRAAGVKLSPVVGPAAPTAKSIAPMDRWN